MAMTRQLTLWALLPLASILGDASSAQSQQPSAATLKRATDPLAYLAAAPSDRCRYAPCPAATVTLDRISGQLTGRRQFTPAENITLGVVNLNPFLYKSYVTVRPVDYPGVAQPDFLRVAPPSPPSPPSPPGYAPESPLPPCVVPAELRARLRLDATRIQAAKARMQVWLSDSLGTPRYDVSRELQLLADALRHEATPASELYAAAWKYREIANVYPPALRASGLADTSRIAPLAAYSEPFADEISRIVGCSDTEVGSWRRLAWETQNTLGEARRLVASTPDFLDELTASAQTIWATASIPTKFFIRRAAGGYDRPKIVFVRLYLFDVDEEVNLSQLRETDAYAGWTLAFRN